MSRTEPLPARQGNGVDAPILTCDARAYSIPTDQPESDGTLQWDRTTLALVRVRAGDFTGIGYTYGSPSVVTLAREHFEELLRGRQASEAPALYNEMVASTRNLGRPGIVSLAISAIDIALWDLRAKQLGVSLASLLGQARDAIRVYGSGCFTSYSIKELRASARQWVEMGIPRVKMKVGREPNKDLARVAAVREAIGDETELFVDANGAYNRKQALKLGQQFVEQGVTWFEEPVSSDDLAGLRLLRDAALPGLEIAAGEYGFHTNYFCRLLRAGAVDVLQADATRCGGITGFLATAAIAEAFAIPFSAHCAPLIHAHLGCVARKMRHLEYFHDHVRIERALFSGGPELIDGKLKPCPDQPGLGVEFREHEASAYRVR